MPTINFKATKMTGAKVSHISLVERGANRIPFKVVKQEKDMSAFQGLDLGGLFSRRKSEKTESKVVAVVTMKGEAYEAVAKMVEEAGFAVASVQEMDDGSMIFKQEDMEIEDLMDGSSVVRLNDHIALVTKGFSPYNMDVTADGVTFADQCSAKGFYPGVSAIMETLADSVRSAVYAAKSPAEAKAAVSKLFSEASAYTSSFVAGLPQKAFKLEKLELPEVADPQASDDSSEESAQKSDDSSAEGASVSGGDSDVQDSSVEKSGDSCGKKKPKATDGKPSSEDMMDEPESQGDVPPKGKAKKDEDSLTEKTVSSIVTSQVEALVSKPLGDMVSKLEAFAEAFQAIQKSVEDLKGGVDKVNSRVDEAEQVAKAAKEAVTGTVVGGGDAGDHAPVTKKEKSGFGGDIDTAFMPRVRKTHR